MSGKGLETVDENVTQRYMNQEYGNFYLLRAGGKQLLSKFSFTNLNFKGHLAASNPKLVQLSLQI